MESAPDSGVAMRKAVVAPLFAPCFFREAAAGSVPHDQSGRGIPNSDAFNTGKKRPFPRCEATAEGLRNIFSIPATAMPKNIYIPALNRIFQHSSAISVIRSIGMNVLFLRKSCFLPYLESTIRIVLHKIDDINPVSHQSAMVFSPMTVHQNGSCWQCLTPHKTHTGQPRTGYLHFLLI